MKTPRRGLVLVVVLIVIVMLALAANTYCTLMLSENQAAFYSGRRIQSRVLAESGVETVLWFLGETEESQREYGGLYNNAGYFQNRVVRQEDDVQGMFTISTASFASNGDYEGTRFGLQDESAKINLNALLAADAQQDGGRDLLVKALGTVGMTETLADRILDFIDDDDEPREFGAEIDYYAPLGLKPKNGPLESLEELLLIPDVHWSLVFGRDLNRNGVIDPEEQQLEGTFYDDQPEQLRRGWSSLLTIYSAEKNLNPQGQQKIDLNNNDLQDLYNKLKEVFDERWATFIVAYRQNGPTTAKSDMQPQARTGELDFDRPGRARLNTVLDLVGVNVTVQFKNETEVLLATPFPNPEEDPGAAALFLPKLWDHVAVKTQPVIPGRVNINLAPRMILEALPGIGEERKAAIVDAILGRRDPELPGADSPHRYETWLLSEGIVNLEEMKQMLPFVCVRGSVYRADVLGYFSDDGPAARIEAILDASRAKPRLLFWRDISHLGTKSAMEAAQGTAE
jgi:DNA uptake protein ComE-like DNA-binding protein